MLDILICIIPKINPDAPTVGPALLKAHLQDEGLSCDVLDLNIKLFKSLREKKLDDMYYFFDKTEAFVMNHNDMELSEEFNEMYNQVSDEFLNWIQIIKDKNPRFVGLSLLSVYSMAVAVKFSSLIREHLPHIKIVWGGTAVDGSTERFRNHNLYDHYIFGDGEKSIIELLKGNVTYKGIDSTNPNQILNLDSLLVPNYDDINWDEYHHMDYKDTVYITASRGCVKRCTFCNVYDLWPEYRFRSGENVANEIIALKEKYNRKTFRFTDSLINGSMKAFRELLRNLKEYRKVNDNFEWISQWIVRPKNQSPEDDYRLMKESGCLELEIGIESFSQPVRYHMGKKFTDEDMWWCFEMLNKYRIRHSLLMIVGYPTETEEDHQHTLATVRKLFELGYATATDDYGSKLIFFSFGNTLMLDDNQPLWKLVKDKITNYKNNLEWDYDDNTFEVRMRRFKEVNDLIKELSNSDSVGWMNEKALRLNEKVLNEEAKPIFG